MTVIRAYARLAPAFNARIENALSLSRRELGRTGEGAWPLWPSRMANNDDMSLQAPYRRRFYKLTIQHYNILSIAARVNTGMSASN